MKNKQKYYRVNRILTYNAQYNMLLGERSNGKSYAVKEFSLDDAYNNDNEFIFLRRWQLETKPTNVEYYFSDAPIAEITKGECNTCYVSRGKIYLARFVNETNTYENKKLVGHVMYLSGETHFKSFSYPRVGNIIFEEFVTNDGYLNDECMKLMSLVSTVARRRELRVWLIGNTISRLNPYFAEWGLRNIPNQKQGTIDTYDFETSQIDENGAPIVVRIAVEFCENSGNNSRMFFGKTSEMITSGTWQTREYTHLKHSRSEYDKLYAVKLAHMGLTVAIELLYHEQDGHILHVYPSPKFDIERQITNAFDISPLVTPRLTPITKGDKMVIDLFNRGKIAYSDNLTGSDFESILREKGGL